MEPNNILELLSTRANIGGRELSRRMGRAETWANNSFGRVPKLDTVANVADVCNCDVCIIDRDTGAVVATVTPPRRASMDRDAGDAVDDLDGAGNGGGA